MAMQNNPNHKNSRVFYLVPGERMSALTPLDEKDSLGPLAGPLRAPEPGPEQPGYSLRKNGRGSARGFFCDRFVY